MFTEITYSIQLECVTGLRYNNSPLAYRNISWNEPASTLFDSEQRYIVDHIPTGNAFIPKLFYTQEQVELFIERIAESAPEDVHLLSRQEQIALVQHMNDIYYHILAKSHRFKRQAIERDLFLLRTSSDSPFPSAYTEEILAYKEAIEHVEYNNNNHARRKTS